jgi:hypothetical protein
VSESTNTETDLKSRLAREIRAYAAISLYLFVCFSVIRIYGASQSVDAHVTLHTFGAAAVKALIIGKFILVGEALKPGSRLAARNLMQRIAWRSLGLLLVLVILKLLEEVIVGLFHDRDVSATIGELIDTPLLALLAPLLIMLLILIPLMVMIEFDKALGAEGLKGLLLHDA